MLLRQERIAFCLLVLVVVGITAGAVLLSGIDKGVLAKDYQKNEPDGVLVRLEGTIEDLRKTQTGGHMIASITGTSIFLPSGVAGKVTLHEGDRVIVYGIVQTFRGTKEIIVQDAADVRVIGLSG
jgi:DNA/RNA endonuclease YhcR with UshA esterase domain